LSVVVRADRTGIAILYVIYTKKKNPLAKSGLLMI
jgi:hypothetical protein